MDPRSLWRTRIGKLLVPLLLAGALVFWNPPFVSFAARSIVSTVALPFQVVLSFVGFHIREFGSFVLSIGEVKRERERLLSENVELRARVATLVDRERENEALRKEIELLPRDRYRLLEAEVIGREGELSGGRLTINRGAKDGVRDGMAVVVGKSVFIGRISGVGPLSSGVLLASHPESAINALDNSTEASGVVRGEYGLGLLFDMVLQTDTIREGDEIITSGLGGTFPRGLLVGTIIRTESSTDRLFQRATLVSPVSFDRVRFAAVLLNENESP